MRLPNVSERDELFIRVQHAQLADENVKTSLIKRFFKKISELIFSGNKMKFNITIHNMISDKMISDLYMFGLRI